MRTVIRLLKYALILAAVVMVGRAGWRAYELHHSDAVVQELREEIEAQQPAEAPQTSGEEQTETQTTEPTAVFPAFLQQQNADLAAWLTVAGTEVDYPVMLTPNDMEHYMYRDFHGNHSACGTPFFDTRCAPLDQADSLLIYGHNMRDGTMFSSLKQYTDAAFGREHRTFTLLLPGGTQTYELFAVLQISMDNDADWALYDCAGTLTQAQFETYVQSFRKRALYTTDVQPQYGDKLLILSTCAYHTHNGRLLVIGCEKTV